MYPFRTITTELRRFMDNRALVGRVILVYVELWIDHPYVYTVVHTSTPYILPCPFYKEESELFLTNGKYLICPFLSLCF